MTQTAKRRANWVLPIFGIVLLGFFAILWPKYIAAVHERDLRDGRRLPYCTDASAQERANGRCLPTGYVRP